jgi:antitoxin component of MazEF toxin-antitoxin module
MFDLAIAKTMYIKKLLRFNNSIGVIIPKPLVKAIGLKFDELLCFTLGEGDTITIIQYEKWVKNKKGKPSKLA